MTVTFYCCIFYKLSENNVCEVPFRCHARGVMGQSRDRLFSSTAAWSISRDGLRLDLFYQKQWLGGGRLYSS